jgi:signal transduction histidine kinase/cell division protein FtsL
MKFVNPSEVSEDSLSVWLAEESLALFSQYGDVYQIAGAYRTLASCYHAMDDDATALDYLHMALSNQKINQAPDLVASIREQLSVAYAALDDKAASDENRNIYLDLQQQTRQDRELQARADMYGKTETQQNVMMFVVLVAIVLLIFMLWLFNYLNQRQKNKSGNELDELLEQRRENLALARLHIETNERRNLEQRAKVSLVNTTMPFIDRIVHAISRFNDLTDEQKKTEIEYIRELTDKINEQNNVLTHWIQLRQGELSLRIESFPLQPLFDMVARGKMSFQLKGIDLIVEPTEAVVKADRILTLFMLNTLSDNARKFTEKGGEVRISASETDSYVEVSVSDTGIGMTEEQLTHLFDHKTINDTPHHSPVTRQPSHGFGLMNCRGIIEKYRKVSSIFKVCAIAAESEQGRGSRLFFRLPKGRVLALGLWLMAVGHSLTAGSQSFTPSSLMYVSHTSLDKAYIYSDSAYFSNVNGNYKRTLEFADSCRKYLNAAYLEQRPGGKLLMLREGDTSLPIPEIMWFHDSLKVNYNVILDIRNESAVAALALHEWSLYAYNNKVYTQLFKETSADNSLEEYCRMMQQSQTNKTIAIVLLLLIFAMILPAYYLLYYRHRLERRFLQRQQQQYSAEMLEDEYHRAELENNNLHVANSVLDNCLSTLKHETMYYPSRIRQLTDSPDINIKAIDEVVTYYRDIYAMLSQQAMRQVEQVKLHLSAVDMYGVKVLGDKTLLRYLFEILTRQKENIRAEVKDDKYVLFTVTMPQLHLSDEEAQNLFTPAQDHISYLLCRQIVRDHSEATNRRGCGIWAENENGTTNIKITLPRWNHSK